MTIQVEGQKINYIRKIHFMEGLYPADEYPEVVAFFQAISEADNAKVRLKK